MTKYSKFILCSVTGCKFTVYSCTVTLCSKFSHGITMTVVDCTGEENCFCLAWEA